MIHSSPEVVPLTVDLDEHLVEMPTPAAGFHSGHATLFDLRRKEWPEPMPSIPYGFVADIDASFVKQVLDVPQCERKPHIQHNGQADNFLAGFEILEWIAFCHAGRLGRR